MTKSDFTDTDTDNASKHGTRVSNLDSVPQTLTNARQDVRAFFEAHGRPPTATGLPAITSWLRRHRMDP